MLTLLRLPFQPVSGLANELRYASPGTPILCFVDRRPPSCAPDLGWRQGQALQRRATLTPLAMVARVDAAPSREFPVGRFAHRTTQSVAFAAFTHCRFPTCQILMWARHRHATQADEETERDLGQLVLVSPPRRSGSGTCEWRPRRLLRLLNASACPTKGRAGSTDGCARRSKTQVRCDEMTVNYCFYMIFHHL
jgi:hypothetical protein